MTYPGIGTTNPAHQLETTSNVKAESLEIYSDYTFFSSDAYDWARQLRLRVNTPSSSNVFVDMGLEKDDGSYFYISNVLSTAADPKNIFRIYQNGRILINRTDATRSEKLQVGGDVKVTGNLNVTGTTTVSGDVNITGDLHVTSFSQEQNYIVPVGMIVMWVGSVATIPPGWALVTDVSGYYLRSDPNQTSVQTGGAASFTINEIASHTHSVAATDTTPSNHAHNHSIGNNTSFENIGHTHTTGSSGNTNTNEVSHNHNYNETTGGTRMRSDYLGNVNTYGGIENNSTSFAAAWNHKHNVYCVGIDYSGDHLHNINVTSNEVTSSHEHTVITNGNVNTINVPLTPKYRQVRLIKKLPYL